jgi:hypothetical protein
MARTQKSWKLGIGSRIAAGSIAAAVTVLTIVAIHVLAAYYAAGPLIVSAAELAT